MIDLKDFTSREKSMLIAPAGYGKTHTIAESLKHTVGRQLILTHTHAGVASIKEKLKKSDVSSAKYSIETITSFAQKYVFAFCKADEIPSQDDKRYYPYIISNATRLLRLKPVKKVITCTYTGLFVDEYQDCTIEHHNLVSCLSDVLPTRLLGDYLQGIFEFGRESLVDMNSADIMGSFLGNRFDLSEPWRWKNGNNEKLGSDLDTIRRMLLQKDSIDLRNYASIETIITKDFYKNNHTKILRLLTTEESILVIHPESARIEPRLKFIKSFNNTCRLIESIDHKDFYALSKRLDAITEESSMVLIMEICNKLFSTTGLNLWFNATGLKRKTLPSDKARVLPLMNMFNTLRNGISFKLIAEILREIQSLPGMKCYRKELFSTLCKALIAAEQDTTSVFESMVSKRNSIRRVGRKIYGRCIGTTLLTKGLEFETVIILNAQQFKCHKNFYVALSRACKKLILLSDSYILSPYKK
ncbi:AAA family ATPase [Rufibacter hautae]|uniref:AAA family ATPase n=1 Tax=Rufibacter hautae TaxID=2595005 RepID=A0A5B6TCR6_9BACT|nr:AAA family ATPase [Rufibacter hautae]KAA3436741.1 AAA family ATPase [Rufibacter hautae]